MPREDEQNEREKIFEELFRHRSRIKVLIRRLVRPHEVDDVEQAVFLELWESIQKLPQNAHARDSWIRSLVRNVSFDWLRKQIRGQGGRPDAVGCGAVRPLWMSIDESGVEAEKVLLESSGRLSIESALIRKEQQQWRRTVFQRALETLPFELRAAYIEIKLNELGSVEAASKLGIARNTLLARVKQACDRIAQSLNIAAVDVLTFGSAGKRVNARVRLESLDNADLFFVIKTNIRDPARFEGLQPGNYLIFAEAAGCNLLKESITLQPGVVELRLTFQPQEQKTGAGEEAK